MKKATLRRALRWNAKNRPGQSGGFVIYFGGNVCEWALDLSEPRLHRPGCIAVDLSCGLRYSAKGGTYAGGAERWEQIPLELSGFTARRSGMVGGDNEHALARR